MPKKLIREHTISFKHAFEGLWYAIHTQPNLKVHFFIAFLVVMLGVWVGITRWEWIILLFTFMWVIVSEMINTSIESMVDLISKEYSQQAKVAKDVSAGMVLVGAMGSVLVGLVVFWPYFIK